MENINSKNENNPNTSLPHLSGEPSSAAIELPDPAVLVLLAPHHNQVVLAEAQLVVVFPLEVCEGPGPLGGGGGGGQEGRQVRGVGLEGVVRGEAHSLVQTENWNN